MFSTFLWFGQLSYGFALIHIGHFFSYSMIGRRASDLIPFHRYVLTTQLASFVYAQVNFFEKKVVSSCESAIKQML